LIVGIHSDVEFLGNTLVREKENVLDKEGI